MKSYYKIRHQEIKNMIINFKNITKVNAKPFQGDDGESVNYFWVKGETSEGETIEFGTMRDDWEVGKTDRAAEIEKTARYDDEGKFKSWKYKEILN